MRAHPSAATTARLSTIARSQIRRDPWPDFASFDAERYDLAHRRTAARQWWRRAREEYGSIHEFTGLAHVFCELRAPIELLAALSRLITDEARHAELCASMAQALLEGEAPDDVMTWDPPRAPWPNPPEGDEARAAWCADVLLCACCIGETISRPLFESLATLMTDPVPQSVVRQILRDEHLHASFGWEALAWLLPQLSGESREWLEGRLAHRLRGFERNAAPDGETLGELAGTEIVVEPPAPDAPPNLGLLDTRTYAAVFYATLEAEVLPRFAELGFDTERAWRER